MTRLMWPAARLGVFSIVVVLSFLDGLGWVLLPGRFVLDLLGAVGPETGRYALFLSGIFYATAALLSALIRRDALARAEAAAFDLRG